VTTKALGAPPALAPLYAKAALTGPLHRGDALPDTVYTLADQSIDLEHLAAYQRVCGFRVSDVLPPTYLHVLAFPLSVALMTQRSFPFPLVGLVHVDNEIVVRRPVRADEVVSFDVRAAHLRPHAAGRQLDLLTQATVGGEVVWSARSTYLRRGGAKGERPERKADRPLTAVSDGESRSAALVKVPDNIGRRYAGVSGDRNPIHMHPLSARAFGFPKAIAHGMWLKARVLASLEGRLPDAYTVQVAFKTPVLLPSTIRITSSGGGGRWDLDVRNARSGKPHLSGDVRPL
jgi:acyl dehydratase